MAASAQGGTASGSDLTSYESVLAQNVQLRLDLQSALTELSRKEDDNATLKQLHESLQELYRRLQEERDALKRRLRHDQAEMDELVRRTQSELARLREQLRAKCRECEELQHHALSPQEITRWRRRLEEELREAELEPIRRQLEGQIAEAQGQARNMERVLEQERGRARVVEVELKDKLDVETTASRSKDQILERSKATMEAERRKAEDLQVEVSRLEQQLEDQETRMRGLREQLQARELQSQQEQLVWKQELDRKVSDEQATRRENQQLQELRHEESLRAEKQLQENEARLVQEYSQKLSSYESQCKNLKDEVLNMSSRQDQERRDWRKQLDEERGRACELKDKLDAETAANRSKDQILETSKATLEAEWRKAEDLQMEVSRLEQQLEDQETCMRGLREQLQARELQSQQEQLVWKQELDRKVSDEQATRRENQQLQELHEETLRAEKQLQANEARLAQDYAQKLRSYESHCKDLKDEVLNMSSRQDQERRDWRKQLDEAQTALEKAEETCTKRLQAMAEDHKKHLQVLTSKHKRSLSKAKTQLQEKQGKYKDLAKQVAQLQSEKAVAVRVCEENKRFFELRLAEHATYTSPRRWRDVSPEMRDLAERHDEHERQLRMLCGD